MKSEQKALVICFIGLILAIIILGVLMGFYLSVDPDDPQKDKKIQVIDISGIVAIILVSIIYWYIFTRVWCISYNLASMWPRMAFRYGLGGGIFFLLFQQVINKDTEGDIQLEEYYPLLVLSLIFGHYVFLFMEIASMGNHDCLITIKDL